MKLFKKDPLHIVPFRSYGTSTHLYAKGRALEDENIDLTKKGFLRMIWIAYKRFGTDLVKNTPLLLTLSDGRKIETQTDDQGYYLVDETMDDMAHLVDEDGILKYDISFIKSMPGRKIRNDNTFEGEILVPSQRAKFGVISDIDDTILHTSLTSRLKWQVVKN